MSYLKLKHKNWSVIDSKIDCFDPTFILVCGLVKTSLKVYKKHQLSTN